MDKGMIEKYISVNPNIQHGKPCINGTRIPIYVILEALAMGMDFDQINKEYGPIPREAIQACILYAALLSNEEERIPQPT